MQLIQVFRLPACLYILNLGCIFFFFWYRLFLEEFQLIEKFIFHINPLPKTCTASATINIPHQSDSLVMTDQSTLKYNYYLKSKLYIIAVSDCILYGFEQMHNTCIHHYRIIQSILTAVKTFCAVPIHSFLLATPGNLDIFYCFNSFAFSRMLHSQNQTVCSFSYQFISVLNMHLRFFYIFPWLGSSFIFSTE